MVTSSQNTSQTFRLILCSIMCQQKWPRCKKGVKEWGNQTSMFIRLKDQLWLA